LTAATEAGVNVSAQYGENLPFLGFPDGSASIAKLSMKWKSMPSSMGAGANVTGMPVAPMYSIITFPSINPQKIYSLEGKIIIIIINI
jgi:hypothetical protein